MVDDDMGNHEPTAHSPATPPNPHDEPYAEISRLSALLREAKEHLDERVAARTAALQASNLELTRSSQAKSEFLARMSHDLRQPLNAIVGFTDLLLMADGEPLSAKQRRHLGHVAAASRQLLGLINDLLDLSRVESGRMEIHPEPCDVTVLLEDRKSVV